MIKDPTFTVNIRGESVANDYHLFPAMKQNLVGHRFRDDRDVPTVATRWLITLYTDVCEQAIEKLVLRYDKCLNDSEN
jgi:hypothetical protein